MEDSSKIMNSFEEYKYGFSLPEEFVFKQDKGLSREKVLEISKIKQEPEWMQKLRLEAYEIFKNKTLPTWGADISDLNFDDIVYYIKPIESQKNTWEDLPNSIKETYERLGIPEAERKFLAGVSAQYESEVVYHSLLDDLRELGVIFTDMDSALKFHEDIVRKYFGKLVPPSDNKFAALNTSVWSGGSFVYVPKGVKVSIPLQAYFRINAKNMGQFERTLIIAEEDSYVHYIEGCFVPGTIVKTQDGYKNIEFIQDSDYVLTHQGRYKKVYKTMKRYYTGPIYKISLSHNDFEICVTPKHPLFAVKRWQKVKAESLRWWLAEDLTQDDYLVLPQYKPSSRYDLAQELALVNAAFGSVSKIVLNDLSSKWININKPHYFTLKQFNNNFFAINYTHIDALCWFLGLIFSGAVEIENNYIHVFLNHLNFEYGYSMLKKVFNSENIKVVGLNIVSVFDRQFVEWLNKNFFAKNGKFTLPNWIFNLTFNQKKLILNGIEYSFQGMSEIKIVNSFDFIHDFQLFLLDLKLKSYIYKINYNEWCLKIDSDNKNIVIENNYMFSKVKSIDVVYYKGYVYNLSVEDDESYVAQGFISHNCTAPVYSTDSLHSAVVEIYCLKGSRVRYTTVQNWSKNVYNLVTKRAIAYEKATMEWIDGNIGSKRTMKYPSIILKGEGAKGIVVSAAYAGKDQEQDTGTKIYHLAPNTSSEVISKSVSQKNGLSTFRSIISVSPSAKNAKISVKCDALLLDDESSTQTIPVNIVNQDNVEIEHEATVSRLKKMQLFYLMSRGFNEDESSSMIVNGFIDIFTRELPMEYAVELNRLISLKMEGSVG